MNLQNGYKVIYEKAADGKRAFYASKTSFFKDAELITEAKIGEYKLIYEKNGALYGSTTGIPTAEDTYFKDFDIILKDNYEAELEDNNVYPEVITANSDTHGDIIVEDDKVTIKVSGEVPYLKSAWGTFGNWVGFRINTPEGVDATKVIYTRPNGKASTLNEVLDPDKTYASVYSDMSKYGETATYTLDWLA